MLEGRQPSRHDSVVIAIRLLLLAGLLGCDPERSPLTGRGARTAPAAVVATQVEPGTPLDDMLRMIQAQLDTALAARLEGDGLDRLIHAEALTDRLPEARLPFDWMADNYHLEARLWQIQTRADRVIALIRTGVRRDDLIPEVQELREDVVRLRAALAEGGTAAPPPVDRLIQQLGQPRRLP
jgi:hypothetical protein